MLQEDTRTVVSIFGGWRGEIRRFVIGGELGFGRADGDLHLDVANTLAIDYANDGQRHWAIHAGPRLGSGTLLFAYVSEVTRQFDVTITSAGQVATQQDEQGLRRFGGGIEQALTRLLHLRLTLGTSRAGFGDRQTNLDIGRRLEVAGGLVIQF